MTARTARDALDERLGYAFADHRLVDEALTHASATSRRHRGRRSNERLEFLGDRVLGLAVATLLYARYPDEPEGSLSKRQAALVSRETLGEIGRELGLGEMLKLARSEAGTGRDNPAILADTFEALLGAVYLDGGFAKASDLVERCLGPRLEAMRRPPRDNKTAIQEWAQQKGLARPAYHVLDQTGPAHAPYFVVEARLGDTAPVRGEGRSKREAEQAAAGALLAHVGADHDG